MPSVVRLLILSSIALVASASVTASAHARSPCPTGWRNLGGGFYQGVPSAPVHASILLDDASGRWCVCVENLLTHPIQIYVELEYRQRNGSLSKAGLYAGPTDELPPGKFTDMLAGPGFANQRPERVTRIVEFTVRNVCGPGWKKCGGACIAATRECCSQGTGQSCDSGWECDASARCTRRCGEDEKRCGGTCIPADAECCGGGGKFCARGTTCIGADRCMALEARTSELPKPDPAPKSTLPESTPESTPNSPRPHTTEPPQPGPLESEDAPESAPAQADDGSRDDAKDAEAQKRARQLREAMVRDRAANDARAALAGAYFAGIGALATQVEPEEVLVLELAADLSPMTSVGTLVDPRSERSEVTAGFSLGVMARGNLVLRREGLDGPAKQALSLTFFARGAAFSTSYGSEETDEVFASFGEGEPVLNGATSSFGLVLEQTFPWVAFGPFVERLFWRFDLNDDEEVFRTERWVGGLRGQLSPVSSLLRSGLQLRFVLDWLIAQGLRAAFNISAGLAHFVLQFEHVPGMASPTQPYQDWSLILSGGVRGTF